MFRTALDELFQQQRQRLATVAGTERVTAAFEALTAMNLDAEAIDKRCCVELQQILGKKYDDPIASSRLAGYGWTTAHVKDHMRRFLQSRIQHAGQVMRSYINGDHDDLEQGDAPDASDDLEADDMAPELLDAYEEAHDGTTTVDVPDDVTRDAFASNLDVMFADV